MESGLLKHCENLAATLKKMRSLGINFEEDIFAHVLGDYSGPEVGGKGNGSNSQIVPKVFILLTNYENHKSLRESRFEMSFGYLNV